MPSRAAALGALPHTHIVISRWSSCGGYQLRLQALRSEQLLRGAPCKTQEVWNNELRIPSGECCCAKSLPSSLSMRARMALSSAQRERERPTARSQSGRSFRVVVMGKWRARFIERRIAGALRRRVTRPAAQHRRRARGGSYQDHVTHQAGRWLDALARAQRGRNRP